MKKANCILVVDDDEDLRQLFVYCLRGEGYKVLEAATGRQGLQMARTLNPDLVLLDVRLPDISGIEVLRRIKADPSLKDVFVALCSGEATSVKHKVDGLHTGADEYLIKPLGVLELLARVQTLMRLRNTAAALRASEDHHRRLIDILPDAVCLIHAKGDILTANSQAVVMLGYAHVKDLLHKSLYDLTPPEDHERIKADIVVALRAGSIRNAEYTMLKKNGLSFRVELSATVSLGINGQSAGLLSVVRDITQHKRAEAELRALPQRIIKAQEAERSRIARELHDGINQLIASVKMRLRKVETSLPDLKPAAREILIRCDRLLVKVLEENRRIAHNLRPTDLDNLGLAAACSSFCSDVQLRTNLQVQCRFSSLGTRLPPVTELHLFRIVQEAVNNIEKHAHAKAIKLQLRFEREAAVLKIQDDGCGFDSNPSKVGHKKWHGLGLTNMRERALSLGGNYEVKSVPNKGTTIIVRVPMRNPKRGTNPKAEPLASSSPVA